MLQEIYDSIDPVAITIGSLSIRWYGLAYLAGFICAILIIWRVSKRWKVNLSSDDLLVILVCIMMGVILGGRLGYVIFYGDGYYLQHPQYILALNRGGMSFHGGLLGVVVGAIVASKLTKTKLGTIGDMMAIGTPAGLFFGRIANFINGELWGSTTDLPWGVVFNGAGSLPRHPSQLYEAILEGLVILIVLYILSRKNPPLYRGTYLGIFLVMYGIFRIMIEFVRQPDAQIGYLIGDWFTMGMLLCIPMIIIGIYLIINAYRKKGLQSEAKTVS